MIHCRLVQVTRNRHGQPIRAEHRVAGETLRIGRSAECAIHLPDHRIRLHHASIHEAMEGRYFIEGEDAAIEVDGVPQQSVELTPGTRVTVGPYVLAAEAADGVTLSLTVELVQPLPASGAILALAPTSLAAAGLSKRGPAYGLALLIAVAFLLLPLLQTTNPGFRQAVAALPATPVQSWNPGPLQAGHRSISDQCGKCHVQALTPVPDRACTQCHRNTRQHSPTATSPACVTCHRDHKGDERESGLVQDDMPLCVSCHGDIKKHRAGSALPDVSDFADRHPGFSPSFARRPGEEKTRRIPLADKASLVEESGLKFSHRAHDGKVRLPADLGNFRYMTCPDCHRPDAQGTGFLPVRMKDHCFDCHRQEFDFNPPQEDRVLPHGEERVLLEALEHFNLKRAIPAQAPQGGRGAGTAILDAAADQARRTMQSLAGDAGCGFCHEIEPGAKDATEDAAKDAAENAPLPWRIKPLAITGKWLPAAHFPHRRHATSPCQVCHAMSRSEQSSDVSIPDIGKCRECHAGKQAADNRIASPCAACHTFHGTAPIRHTQARR